MADPAVDAFAQGLELMLAGMGTVFVFLTLLVAATTLMSSLVQRFAPDLPGHTPGVRLPRANGNEAEVVAAITVAIAAFRRRSADSSQSPSQSGSQRPTQSSKRH